MLPPVTQGKMPPGKPAAKQGDAVVGTDKATIQTACTTVFAGGKAVARAGDTAMTCNDPVDAPNGTVVAASSVMVG